MNARTTTLGTAAPPGRSAVGDLLRRWRERRRLSQLELSLRAEISTRHLSFVETGRAAPSREMVLLLAEHLDVPLRERNRLLLAAGYAPLHTQLPLQAPELAPVRTAIRQLLEGHEPYPALVVDRGWHLVDGNSALDVLTDLVDDERLLRPPANVLRATLHPRGLAPHIVNLAAWRAHLLGRLTQQLELTGDEELADLLDELRGYPGGGHPAELPVTGDIVVPIKLRVDGAELTFLSMIATFGTPLDVTVSELSIESFFPADETTSAALLERARARGARTS
jgi:transcriptional regulator with XRE-family HTH domain